MYLRTHVQQSNSGEWKMSAAIQFLAILGRTPQGNSDEVIRAMLSRVELQPDVRGALMSRDADALARLLGGRASMSCAVAMPENDEPRRDDDEQPDEGETDAPSMQAMARVA